MATVSKKKLVQWDPTDVKEELLKKYPPKVARKRFNARLKEDLKYYELVYMEELMKTHDGKEGLASFLEKRKPEFKGK